MNNLSGPKSYLQKVWFNFRDSDCMFLLYLFLLKNAHMCLVKKTLLPPLRNNTMFISFPEKMESWKAIIYLPNKLKQQFLIFFWNISTSQESGKNSSMRLCYEWRYDISVSFTWNLTSQGNKFMCIWHWWVRRYKGRRAGGGETANSTLFFIITTQTMNYLCMFLFNDDRHRWLLFSSLQQSSPKPLAGEESLLWNSSGAIQFIFHFYLCKIKSAK